MKIIESLLKTMGQDPTSDESLLDNVLRLQLPIDTLTEVETYITMEQFIQRDALVILIRLILHFIVSSLCVCVKYKISMSASKL